MTSYFKNKNWKSKKKWKNYKVLFARLKTRDAFVMIAKTSTSVTLTVAGFELVVKQSSVGIAYGLNITDKVSYEMPIENCETYYNIAQQTFNSSDKFSKMRLHDNKHMNLFVKKFQNNLTQVKLNLFWKI